MPEHTCDYADCDESTTVQDVAENRYCDSDHHMADANGWPPDELDEYGVEYDGVSGTYRAPDRETADSQWRSHVMARR